MSLLLAGPILRFVLPQTQKQTVTTRHPGCLWEFCLCYCPVGGAVRRQVALKIWLTSTRWFFARQRSEIGPLRLKTQKLQAPPSIGYFHNTCVVQAVGFLLCKNRRSQPYGVWPLWHSQQVSYAFTLPSMKSICNVFKNQFLHHRKQTALRYKDELVNPL
jgi:hypothetical protein